MATREQGRSGASVVPLDWDSAFFGFPIARIDAERPDRDALAAALEVCRGSGVRCAYLLLDAADDDGSGAAQSLGFVVRDVRVELDRPLSAGDRDAGEGAIATAGPEQMPALEALARERFTMSRFFADPGFPRERCRELYAAFVRRGLSGDPHRWTLASPGANGCIVCLADPGEGLGTIDLVVARRPGEGTALVRAAVASFARAGLSRAVVATQAQNIAAQRSYQRAGFRTCAGALWLHRWFD
jgi:dTDP-4-amino-4,6-dideoxy-D-galactose acyltransferase